MGPGSSEPGAVLRWTHSAPSQVARRAAMTGTSGKNRMFSRASRCSDLMLSIISRTAAGGALPRCVIVRLLSASSCRSRSSRSISSVTASGRIGRRRMREIAPDGSVSLTAPADESELSASPDFKSVHRAAGVRQLSTSDHGGDWSSASLVRLQYNRAGLVLLSVGQQARTESEPLGQDEQ